MRLYTPPGLPPQSPLVVALHGCTQTGEGYARAAGWLTLADRYGFAVLCPEQTRGNNPNLCFNWYEPGDAARDGGEAASIAAMVGRALADHALDARRTFVTGLSAGGAMAAVMLATRPGMFAGGAVIAGLAYGAADSLAEAFGAMRQTRVAGPGSADKVRAATGHRGPWPPLSIWHGENDTIVRPAAGEALARQWRELHGIDGEAVTMRTSAGREFLVWKSPAGAPVVELHRISGMGHGVPLKTGGVDGAGTAGPHMFDVGVSSSLEIAQGWGIADRRLDLGQSRAHLADPRPPARGAPAGAGHGVREVIEKALRSAGLMK
ncbi:PHB depolymerase family esterase [Brevundimonas sp.]|uniref:extracellular catalytic domain type 1 short-chain-length polyhydroxyalkanoate depolymerase n=1 Tax=Brevundimonas sp. TaxID=1871086 RepID=UPI00272FBC61|nr:PHB depolymerase family esterase [Brevundimonas sp.]MDP1911726.1 PHB depolymerase family esterase [Brevundimonas sp.]